MMKKTHIALSATAASALLLTACGGEDVEDVPEFGEIEDFIFDAMESSDSVTITISGISEAGETTQGMGMMGMEFDGLSVFGEVDGPISAMSLSEADQPAFIFDEDSAYLSAGFFFDMFTGMGGIGSPDEQEMLEALSVELDGYWLDFSDEMANSDDEITVGSLLEEMSQSWESDDSSGESPLSPSEIESEGVYEQRDDQDAWVYQGSEDGSELVVEADHDAPRMISATDGDVEITFTQWDSTETPEMPSDDDVLTEDELSEMVEGFAVDQGW